VAEKNKQLLTFTSVQRESAVRRNCADGIESVQVLGRLSSLEVCPSNLISWLMDPWKVQESLPSEFT